MRRLLTMPSRDTIARAQHVLFVRPFVCVKKIAGSFYFIFLFILYVYNAYTGTFRPSQKEAQSQ